MQSLPEMDHFLTCAVPGVQGLRGRVILSPPPPTVCRQVIRAASEVSARTRSIRLSRGYQEPGTQHQHQLKFNLCWTGRKERGRERKRSENTETRGSRGLVSQRRRGEFTRSSEAQPPSALTPSSIRQEPAHRRHSSSKF